MRFITGKQEYGLPVRWVTAVCVGGLLLLLATAAGWGQEVTAAITGKITDPSGASINDAKVTATDIDRGTVGTTSTNGDGVYNLPRLPIGSYNIKVEKQGFQTSLRSGVVLQLNDIARLDFQL